MDQSLLPPRAEPVAALGTSAQRLAQTVMTTRPDSARPVLPAERADAAPQSATRVIPLDTYAVGDNDDVPEPPERPRQPLILSIMVPFRDETAAQPAGPPAAGDPEDPDDREDAATAAADIPEGGADDGTAIAKPAAPAPAPQAGAGAGAGAGAAYLAEAQAASAYSASPVADARIPASSDPNAGMLAQPEGLAPAPAPAPGAAPEEGPQGAFPPLQAVVTGPADAAMQAFLRREAAGTDATGGPAFVPADSPALPLPERARAAAPLDALPALLRDLEDRPEGPRLDLRR